MKAQLVDGELILHGPVGMDFIDEHGLFAADVRRSLVGMSGPLTVRLNSGGGVATEGAAIHSVLKSYPGTMTIIVEGIAASAASLLAMAANEIVMAEGSLMMIHDPSGMTIGPASVHRKTADELDVHGDEYASIYARRAGLSTDEMRTLMKEELWMGGEEAVERGFADATVKTDDEPAMAAFPYQKFASAPDHLVQMAKDKGWRADALRPIRAAVPAVTKEATMAVKEKTADKDTPKEVQTDAAKPEAPEMDAKVKATLDAAARREAVMSIAGARLTGTEIEEIVAKHSDPAEAKMAAVDLIADKRISEEAPIITPSATVTADASEKKFDAMRDALAVTMFGGELEGAAKDFAGLTPKRLAIELAGGFKHGFSDYDLIKKGMSARGVLMSGGFHSTSDFTYLTASTMNRALRSMYQSRPGTWRRISRIRSAADFRTLYSVQAGGDFSLQSINETGEYKNTILTDTGEQYAVARKGRKVTLSFEAVINDDMSAFSRIPMDFARGALNMESSTIWGLVNANGNMSDGNAFFDAAHSNIDSSGAAISAASVGAARKAMWEQRTVGADATGDDFIEATPDLLFVPPALEITALQFATATTPDTDSNTNPFKNTLTPVTEARLGAAVTGGDDAAWYLFDSQLPPVEAAFLQGFEAPMIEAMEKIDPDGVCVIARHIFGAGLVEYRGAYKNVGA